MIKIVNLKDVFGRGSHHSFVRVDRHHSVLGNPFLMNHEDDRLRVIEEYRRWLWAEIKKKQAVWEELHRLYKMWKLAGKLTLACWCAPNPCHAEIIRNALLWMEKGGAK